VLEVDHVIAAPGYRADLAPVPYLAGVLDRGSVTDGSRISRRIRDVVVERVTPYRLGHRVRRHPRLRAVLWTHQGLPVRLAERGAEMLR
jgi:hypothetical protein